MSIATTPLITGVDFVCIPIGLGLTDSSGGQQTVQAVLRATGEEIERAGLDHLSTKRIAAAAGLSVGSLYGYFPNKGSILLDMARREMDALRDRVKACGILTAAGLGPYQDVGFRIGHMGDIRMADVERTLIAPPPSKPMRSAMNVSNGREMTSAIKRGSTSSSPGRWV